MDLNKIMYIVSQKMNIHLINGLIKNKISFDKTVKISSKTELQIIMGGRIVIGSYSEIMQGVLLMTYGGDIIIGKNCSINPYTIIYGHGNTLIGDNVLIAGHTMIIPSNHNFERIDIPIIDQGSNCKGVIIEDNVWIGHGCSILDGVKIGSGAIVAAGSVVTKSIPPHAIYGGVPAELLKIRI